MTVKAQSLQGQWQCLYPQVDTNSATIDSACISLDNRGLAYGDGFFTTMGVIDGAVLWQDYHVKRLISHAQALQLNIDNQDHIAKLIVSLQAQAGELQQGIMKLIVTRATQTARGYGFVPNTSGSDCEIWLKATSMSIDSSQYLCLANTPLIPLQPNTQAVCLTSQLASMPPPLAGLKSLNRLDSVLASGELQRINAASAALGFGEGLLRDMTGRWVEGTMSNVFYQLSSAQLTDSSHNTSYSDHYLSGQWFTSPIVHSGVAGVMRQVLLDSFANTDLPVIMRPLKDKDLPNLQALFFCNAVRGVIPVSELSLLSGKVIHF
ncbi:aminotransferase class IV [uncultured Psychrobacter sp.]|uniref:aminotransferase class IV n=1 Tax=uncultured Psychrobacter sp. TaxID=259303 RepID=UPI003457BA6E